VKNHLCSRLNAKLMKLSENFDDVKLIGKKRSAKIWTKRPVNWVDIVEEADAFGSREAIRSYEEEFEGHATKASLTKINRWQKDHKKKKTYVNVPMDRSLKIWFYWTFSVHEALVFPSTT
jgi:hypothetical protein